jgi:hypothetical protein
MLNRLILICLFGSLTALSATAAEGAKASTAQASAASAKPNEAAGKIAATPANEPTITAVPKKHAKWSNTRLDLTHCLNRESNTAIIKCVE